jgi:hypothetical protein
VSRSNHEEDQVAEKNNVASGTNPAGGAHSVLLAVAALGALISIPLFLHDPSESVEAGTQNTVSLLYAGLAASLVIATLAIKNTPFRERRGAGMTDDELIAELEAQFEDDGLGPTN